MAELALIFNPVTGGFLGKRIRTEHIVDASITSAKIAANAIGAGHIINGAIGTAELATNAVTAAKIAANAVGASELANNSVDTAAILSGAVIGDKIAANAIGAGHIIDGAIATAELANLAVTSAKLAALDASKVTTGAFPTARIADAAITSAKVAAGTVGGALLQDWGVLSGKIASGAVQPDNIHFLAGMISRPTPPGAVLDLDFAEAFIGNPTIVYDKSGYNNDGTVHGAIAADGIFGKALSFDGVDDYVEMADDPSFSGLSAITVEAWFNTNDPSLSQRIISKMVHPHEFSLLLVNREIRIQLFTDVGNVNNPGSLSNPLANTWHHGMMTYDGANVRLYLDSIEAPNSPWPLTGTINDTTGALRIGHNQGTAGQFFNGLIDEVRIYNRALSADEIRGRYIQGLARLGKIQGAFRGFDDDWKEVYGFTRTGDLGFVGTLTSGSIPDARILSGLTADKLIGTVPALPLSGRSLADLGNKAHGLLTGIGANDHHIQFTSGMHSFPHPTGLIADGAITSAKIAANAIGGGHIIDGAIATAELANLAVTSAKIAANAVGASELANNAVTGAKIAANAIGAGHIINGAVGTAELATDAVTAAKIAANAIGASELANNAVDTAAILSGAVIGDKIAANAIGAGHIINGAVGTAELATNAITSAKVAAGTVGGALLQDWGVLSGKVASGAIQPDDIHFLAGMISRPTPPGAVLDLDFAEAFIGNPTIVYDKSGYNNDGTVHGAIAADGIFGKALSFDGVDDYVDAGNDASLDITDAITVEARIKPNTVSGLRTISEHLSSYIFRTEGLNLVAKLFVGGIWYDAVVAFTNINTWSQVSFTYDTAWAVKKAKIYVNGEEITYIRQDTIPAGSLTSPTVSLRIGARSAIANQFNGLIDEVRIYNWALSPDEIRGRYIQGLARLGKIQGAFRGFDDDWKEVYGFTRTGDLGFVGTLTSGSIPDARVLSGLTADKLIGTVPALPLSGRSLADLGDKAHGLLTGITPDDHHIQFTSGMHNFPHPTGLIADGAVTTAKIAANAVGASELANNAVDTAAIRSGAVTGAKIAANAIGAGHIVDGAIGTVELATNAVTSAKIAAGAVGNAHVAAELDTSKITTGRFPMPRMPDGPEGWALAGQGLGVNPAFVLFAQFRLVTVHLGELSPGHDIWTDLNLSTVVGTRSTPVMLRFERVSGVDTRLRLRENGVVSDVPRTDRPMALSIGSPSIGMHFVTIIRTDTHGIIEWIDQWATTYDVWILGYWET